MTPHPLELQLASARQRFNSIEREVQGDDSPLVIRLLQELHRALEMVRTAQEQLVTDQTRITQLQAELVQQAEHYRALSDAFRGGQISNSDTISTNEKRATPKKTLHLD